MRDGICRKITIVVRGDNGQHFKDALDEATRLISDGYIEGANNNYVSGFYFNTQTDVPDGEQPR